MAGDCRRRRQFAAKHGRSPGRGLARRGSARMNIVMPMAGRGSRFVETGVTTPKPLIPVRGKPMYAWATEGLPLAQVRRLIFICLGEHLIDQRLAQDIRAR